MEKYLESRTMIRLLRILNQRLDLPSRIPLLAFALCGVLIVGGADYLSGYEVSGARCGSGLVWWKMDGNYSCIPFLYKLVHC